MFYKLLRVKAINDKIYKTAMSGDNFHTLKEVQNFVQDNSKCIIKFSAEWCAPCKTLAETMSHDSIVNLMSQSNIKIANVHIIQRHIPEEVRVIFQHYNVNALPTLLFFNNQEVFISLKGSLERNELIKKIEHFINY